VVCIFLFVYAFSLDLSKLEYNLAS